MSTFGKHDDLDDWLEIDDDLDGLEDELPPTLRDPGLDRPTVPAPAFADLEDTPAPDPEPYVTQWLYADELARKDAVGHKAVSDFILDAVLRGCGDLYQESAGRSAFAVVFSPRLYAYAAARMPEVFAKGAIPMSVAGFCSTTDIHVPIYLQVPCLTSDLRMTCVMYPTLERMKERDEVLHGLVADKALRNLGLSAEAFEEPRRGESRGGQ